MWYKKSESIHFDWIMGDLFDVCWDFEKALEDWSDDKWKNVFEQEIAKRGYTDEINDVVRKELVRFFSWRDETVARWKVEEEEKQLEKICKEQEEREWQEELERQTEHELTPFEEVLNEVFDNAAKVLLAAYDWSIEDWHRNFEEKIAVRLKFGWITEEIAADIRKDLDEYIEMILKDLEEYDKEDDETAKKKEEEERIKRELLEKEWAEDHAREQRKVKSLPEVMKLIERYSLAKSNLADEKSVEHYQNFLNACYNVVSNWGFLGCLDEFAGAFQEYEDSVLAYLHTIKSIDSLYQTVFYYTGAEILQQIDFAERKKHLLKGLPYVQAFHDIIDDEESARIYIDYYFWLDESCRSGEDLEQLSYVDKAYKLAKKYALKYKTDEMLEKFELAKLAITAYYRMHDQEIEAEKIEKEYEDVKSL